MLLAIDVGNTNIVIGCIKNNRILFNERVSTNHRATDLEYAIQLKTIIEIHNIDKREIEGAVMSSVVPSVTGIIKRAVQKLLHIDTLVVGPGIKTGLRILTDNPAQLGSDLVVDAVAGINYYSAPLIIIDMGTATTMSVIDRDGNYAGGMIIPGMRTSLDALVSGAAQLPKIQLEKPENVVGTYTAECMKSGIMNYTASGLDGCIEKIEEELGYKCTVIATGGLSGLIAPLCRKEVIYDNDLLLKGLMVIYNKNRVNNHEKRI
ncbi:MAG: type III pantothenate kinase [Clostridiales bacterium]|nr:type III pantothenate kinase [Clostridiales bacterium]